jgi:hypothetical protein
MAIKRSSGGSGAATSASARAPRERTHAPVESTEYSAENRAKFRPFAPVRPIAKLLRGIALRRRGGNLLSRRQVQSTWGRCLLTERMQPTRAGSINAYQGIQ